MGSDKVSARGLEVVGIDKQKNLLIVKGAVPGFTGSLIEITRLGRIKGYTPPPEEKPSEEEEQAAAESQNDEGAKQEETSSEPTAEAVKEGAENAS
jgi:hypothetical protein